MMYLKSAILHQGIPTIEWLNKTDGCNNRYKTKFSVFYKKKKIYRKVKTAFSVKRIAERFVNYRLSDQSADYNREGCLRKMTI